VTSGADRATSAPLPEVDDLSDASRPAHDADAADKFDVVPEPTALGLTVAAVARRLGVAPATLRTWDRRYGLGPSAHTAGAHRRYTSSDIARLDLMRRLVVTGVPPADAARTALTSNPAMQTAPTSAGLANYDDLEPLLNLGPISGPGTISPAELDDVESDSATGRAGGGRVVAIPGGTPAARGLARAALALDSNACNEILETAIDRRGVIWTWDHLLVPVLVAVGQRWAETGTGVEVEHLLSESVIGVFKTTAGRLRNPVNARTVLLGCLDEEQHSLPLFAVAAALSERRIGARVLGARLPAASMVSAVRRTGPAAIFLWSQTERYGSLAQDVHTLPEVRPAPLLLIGGPGWAGGAPAGAVRVTDLTDAVTRISAAVGV